MDVMRDIGSRIQRYRLSRYAAPENRVRRRLRWVWLVGGLWLVWVAVLSDHSFWRLWQMSRERARMGRELQDANRDLAKLSHQTLDPEARRLAAEHALRENMMMTRKGEIIYRIEDEKAPEK
jgi:cell division protein FtsB